VLEIQGVNTIAWADREEHLKTANQLPHIGCKSCQEARTRINKEIAFGFGVK
jgi:hypothetical protein